MRVRLRELPGGTILVTRVDVMGGPGGREGLTVAVSAGESYHGYKHRRLRRMGPGVHQLRRRVPPQLPAPLEQD